MNLKKFPFKSMIKIVNYMASHKDTELKVPMIQNVSNACSSDTLEVTEMISYLTSFGKIEKSELGWIKHSKGNYLGREPYRVRFLDDFLKILRSLSEEPKSISNLLDEVKKINEKDLIEILMFLEQVTSQGFVQKSGRGWKMLDYKIYTPLIQ